MEFYRFLVVTWSVITTLTVVNASENIALRKATNQSSVHNNWDSSKAVDGCTNTSIGSNCCTHTDTGQTEAWWQVVLQTLSVIDIVNITYRVGDGYLHRLAGYEIYLSNTSDLTSGTRCHKDTTADLASMSATQNVQCPGIARYLTIYNDRRVKARTWYSDTAILELCEVQVYGCPFGKYGNGNCNNDCINCVNNLCDATSGTCDECAAGYYKNVGSCIQCPSNCVGNDCNSLTGVCSDCYDGFYGPVCTPCPSGCSTDTCDKTSGHCDRLIVCCKYTENGYQIKDSGQCTDCYDGFYGPVCTPCPSGCSTNTCDKTSGHCDHCYDGFYGPVCTPCPSGCSTETCNKTSGHCDQCIDGYYGSSCAQPCPTNCNGNACIKDNGFCTECISGVYGSTCDQMCSSNCEDNLCIQGNGFCKRCKQGFHGNTCQQSCPVACKDNSCSQFSGQCEECAVGYYGIQCNKICPLDCKDRLCNQTNGRCIGCEAEYYGINCSLKCPDNCKDHICMQENGQCKECVSGFHGSKCVDRCGYCQDGRCDKDTGNCMTSCIDGLTGDRCDVKVVNVPCKGDDFKSAAIGIGIGSGVVIVALVIVIIVLVRRLHSGGQRDTTRSTTMTDISLPSIEQQLQTETDGTYDVIKTMKREEVTPKEYPTDDKYERLGERERAVSHIYENK